MAERPNELTEETMLKSSRGEDVHCAESAADLFEQLGIGVTLPEDAEERAGLKCSSGGGDVSSVGVLRLRPLR